MASKRGKKAGTGRDFLSFANKIEDIAGEIPGIVNAAKVDIMLSAVANIAKRTPVDVGTARSNWIASVGAPASSTRAAFSPFPSRWRPRPGVNPGGPLNETRNQAGTVWAATSAIKNVKPDQDIYLTNNLPYIGRLNDGWSKQAPAGFVQAGVKVAASEAKAIIEKHFRKLNK